MPRYLHDPKSGQQAPNGAITYSTPGAFRSMARVENCPCDDNVRRLVYITGEPDSFYSVPAAVRVKGTWVGGFVTFRSAVNGGEIDASKEGPHFIATGKHKDLIPDASKLARALEEGR
jgi:hypothetical protein